MPLYGFSLVFVLCFRLLCRLMVSWYSFTAAAVATFSTQICARILRVSVRVLMCNSLTLTVYSKIQNDKKIQNVLQYGCNTKYLPGTDSWSAHNRRGKLNYDSIWLRCKYLFRTQENQRQIRTKDYSKRIHGTIWYSRHDWFLMWYCMLKLETWFYTEHS